MKVTDLPSMNWTFPRHGHGDRRRPAGRREETSRFAVWLDFEAPDGVLPACTPPCRGGPLRLTGPPAWIILDLSGCLFGTQPFLPASRQC